jgi:hypothetical protein
MEEEYYDKAARLLDIIHNLVESGQIDGPEELPFSIDTSGGISLHHVLDEELSKDSNRDLKGWVEVNIKDLF